MKKVMLFISLLFATNLRASECVPPHEYFPFSGNWVSRNDNGTVELGMYARVSPDGKYILRSFSGKGLSQVTLMELKRNENKTLNNSVIPYETPLSNEAFPVQGTWRYLVDTNGDHYKLTDILKKQKKAKKQFKGGISGFYTVAAELSGGSASSHQIRSLSWPSGNSENQGVGVLSNRIIKAGLDKNGVASKMDNGSVEYMCKNLRSSDGDVMSLPMISLDGSEFASMPQNPKDSDVSMRIYKFGNDHKSCERVLDLNVIVSKIIFSKPELNAVLFYASGAMGNRGNGVYFYDRDLKKTFTLDDPLKRVHADSFPGFTNDGRIVYGAFWQDCQNEKCIERAGYVISDPYQSSDIRDYMNQQVDQGKKFKACITTDDVNKSLEEQEKIWSYKIL